MWRTPLLAGRYCRSSRRQGRGGELDDNPRAFCKLGVTLERQNHNERFEEFEGSGSSTR
jgi:hypothetical protein